MEQLKPILAQLKKYHFWILCALILVAYLGTWFVAISKMTSETESRVSKINSDFSTARSIQGVTNHPNDESVAMMQALTRAEAEQVRKAWERRFHEQEDVLVWPSELKPDFIAAVQPLIPIELAVDYPTPPEKELKLDFRNRYRDYIREEMPKLAEIIGSKWIASTSASSSSYGSGSESSSYGLGSGSGSGYGYGYGEDSESEGSGSYSGGYGMARGRAQEEDPIIVAWSPQNQSQLQAASFNWIRPTTVQMLYAQEDLWILRSLMLIIKATNGDADAQYNAAVKEIISLDLGPAARGIKSVGRVSAGRAASSGYGSSSDYGSSAGYEPESSSDGEGSSSGSEGSSLGSGSGSYGSGMAVARDPADYRYVDDKMEPLTGERLRTAMKTGSASDAFLVVAKRMPVRLRLRMNVLKVPLLLCECANSNLPVEVRQVRINAPVGGSTSGGYSSGPSMSGAGTPGAAGAGSSAGVSLGAYDGGMGSSYGMGSGYGMSSGYGYGSESEGEGEGSGSGSYSGMSMRATGLESPYDATVEIYGLIYLYNPVDPSKLGLDDTATDAAAGGTATTPPAPVDSSGAAAAEAPATDTTDDAATAPGAEVPATPEADPSTATPATPATPGTDPAAAAAETAAGAADPGTDPTAGGS